jgi:hypothetical protein
LEADGVRAICIVYLDHKSLAAIRFAVRRVRKKFPRIPIALCLWGGADLAPAKEAAKADATFASLSEVIEFCAPADFQEKAEEPETLTAVAPLAG